MQTVEEALRHAYVVRDELQSIVDEVRPGWSSHDMALEARYLRAAHALPSAKAQTAIGTLSAYLDYGRSLSAAGTLLHIHPKAVRYRIDPARLAFVHANLPQPVDRELLPPVVFSAFREIAPNYLVRDLVTAQREQIRREGTT